MNMIEDNSKRKPIKSKKKTAERKKLNNLLLLLNYTSYTNARCNHISNVATHVTPSLQWDKHKKSITRVGLLKELIHPTSYSQETWYVH